MPFFKKQKKLFPWEICGAVQQCVRQHSQTLLKFPLPPSFPTHSRPLLRSQWSWHERITETSSRDLDYFTALPSPDSPRRDFRTRCHVPYRFPFSKTFLFETRLRRWRFICFPLSEVCVVSLMRYCLFTDVKRFLFVFFSLCLAPNRFFFLGFASHLTLCCQLPQSQTVRPLCEMLIGLCKHKSAQVVDWCAPK